MQVCELNTKRELIGTIMSPHFLKKISKELILDKYLLKFIALSCARPH